MGSNRERRKWIEGRPPSGGKTDGPASATLECNMDVYEANYRARSCWLSATASLFAIFGCLWFFLFKTNKYVF